MKPIKFFGALLFALLLVACGDQIRIGGWEMSECTIYQDIGATPENSLIAQRIPNPCQAQDLIGTAAKLGVVWGAYEVEEFDKWATLLENYLNTGVTYNDLMLYVQLEVAKLNTKLGATFIIISDLIVQFPDKELIREKDKTLALMSIADLKEQVRKLALIAQKARWRVIS